MLSNQLKHVSKQMIARYSNRYRQHGYDIKTLGWGTVEQQCFRFLITLSADIDFNNKTIADIGCGFGDYYAFLKDKNINISQYTGIDINPDFIGKANEIYIHEPKVQFKVRNLLKEQSENPGNYDIGVMLGLLNVHLKESFDNYRYSEQMIENAFSMINQLLIVEFISTQRTDTYPKEDFIFYHDPIKMLEFALTLSSNVVLKHNYQPIPQREFMLFIYKDKS